MVGGDIPQDQRDEITKQVTEAINNATAEFRKCYAKSLKRGMNEKGEVDVELLLQPGPTIGALRAGKGDLTDQKLIDCTVKVFESLPFPSPPANYTIIAPIQYRPQ